MKKLGLMICIGVTAVLAFSPVTISAIASPASAMTDMASECVKNGKKSSSRLCKQGGTKKTGVQPPKVKTQGLGDCEVIKGHLASAEQAILLYRKSASRWTNLLFVGRSPDDETANANAHVQQVGAAFTSALGAAAFGPSRELLANGIGKTVPADRPSTNLATYLWEVRAAVLANVEAGRC